MLVLIPCLVFVGCENTDGGNTTTDPLAPPRAPDPFTLEGRWDASMSVDLAQVFGTETPGTVNFVCTTGGSGIQDHVTFGATAPLVTVSSFNITLPNCGTIAAGPVHIHPTLVIEGVHLALTYPEDVQGGTRFTVSQGVLGKDVLVVEAGTIISLTTTGGSGQVRFDIGPNERRYVINNITLTLFR